MTIGWPPKSSSSPSNTAGGIVGVDGAVTQVADQQIVAERAEVSWGYCYAPGRIERSVRYRGLGGDQVTGGVEDLTKPLPGPA